ncbi:hypothetical protein AA0115_g3124 [Alternaria tenuissima]|uniref:Uncharacterized protein n=1 Tax=Alternaria tenuissima TaxID=119927 RepID=A0AB37WSW7_9PLEO|nr:hypothetical protein AA0115_g3124 [Alternaria tenuissima]
MVLYNTRKSTPPALCSAFPPPPRRRTPHLIPRYSPHL